jgi:uncharacterized membrane protein YoaK (UPF0700 family)
MNTRSPGPAPASASSFDRRYLIVLLLDVAGGSVDAIMILGFNVLTAAQTGNTILLAASVAQGHFQTSLQAAISVIGYVVGAAVGELVISRGHGAVSWAAQVDWGLVVEFIVLSLLFACWLLAGHNPPLRTASVLVGLAAVAMGIQSSDILRRHIGPTTTYITGTLTTFAMKAVSGSHLLGAAPLKTSDARDRDPAVLWSSKSLFIFGVDWLVYAGGACAGAILFLRVHEAACVLPMIVVFAAIIAGSSR